MASAWTEEEQRLRNALRHHLAGGSVSGIKELVMGKISRMAVSRTLLPSLQMGALPFKSVTVLDLSKSRLGPHAFSCLMYAVAGAPPTLKELDVSWNMATADCTNAVAAMVVSNASLERLVISNNPLTTCVGDDLGRALKTNRTLKSLEMQAVGLMDATSLFDGMSNHPGLTALNINSNTCTPKAWVRFGQSMSAGIALTSLQAKSADMRGEGASALSAAIRAQKVMTDLDVSGCNIGASEAGELLEALSMCKDVKRVVLANNKFKGGGDLARSLATLCGKSALSLVDLSNCELSDESAKACIGSLLGGKGVAEFNLSANNLGESAGAALRSALLEAWKAEKRPQTVAFSGNNVQKLLVADVMADDYDDSESEGAWLPDALDIGESKATPEILEAFAQMFEAGDGACTLKKLRLDGSPMGKPPGQGRLPRGAPVPPPIISSLLAVKAVYSKLTAVTLSNASLKDAGASYLAECIKNGWKVTELDLGMNEIGCTGCSDIANALIASDGNQLQRLQLRLNGIRNDGGVALAKALGNDNCKLKFVGLTSNIMGTVALKALMQAVGSAGALEILECDNQKEAVWKEEDFTAGAAQLRIAISKRPVDKPSLLVNLGNIEGMGLPSAAIDCGAVVTVYADKHKISSLSLQDCLDIYFAFRGPVTIKDLESMLGGFGTAPGNSPSWLTSADMRARAVHVAHLQLSITKDRLTDWFECEADASVVELFVCVDKALKTPNGFAWVLFKDAVSVEKSIKLYNEGHAAIYGSPFIISTITVDCEESEAGAGNIQAELAERAAAEASRKAQERSDIDEAYAKNLEKQKNQKAAYGGSDMGMSHSNTLGGQNCVKTFDDGKSW